MNDSNELSRATEDLKRQFAQWRQTRRRPSPIPAELWKGAVELAARQGIHRTARALGLDFNALKKRMPIVPAAARQASGEPQANFVELLSPLSSNIAECSLEVESARGSRLRIDMKNVAPLGLATIISQFAG
jgi:hypothetical protein